MKLLKFFAVLLILALGTSCEKTTQFTLSIEAGNASTSLRELARHTNVEILINEKDLSGIQTKAVEGKMSVAKALKLMTAGSGIEVRYDSSSKAIILLNQEIEG